MTAPATAGRPTVPPPCRRPWAAVPECYGEVCITCSDTAVEVTVVRLLEDGLAVVDTGQGEEEVSVALVPAQARRHDSRARQGSHRRCGEMTR